MENLLKNFPEQFSFQPEITNPENLKKTDKFIVAGLGGSHLPADFIKTANSKIDLLIHRDYGLPRVPDYFLNESLIICSSYSGNTEETLDVFSESLKRGLSLAVISSGGELLRLAEENKIPFIKIPAGFPPRLALGFSTLALLSFLKEEKEITEIKSLSAATDFSLLKEKGKELAEKIRGKIPVVYSSSENFSLAYFWKTVLNETGKTPAFFNIFPELNHNEIEGFDFSDISRPLSENFIFIFLSDAKSHSKILKRMNITRELYENRGLFVIDENLMTDGGVWKKIFSSVLLSSWLAFYLAEFYGSAPEKVPLIEELKSLMKK